MFHACIYTSSNSIKCQEMNVTGKCLSQEDQSKSNSINPVGSSQMVQKELDSAANRFLF